MKQLLLWMLLLFAAWKGYGYFVDRPAQEAALAAVADGAAGAVEVASRDPPVQTSPSFKCDGRTHCSQMTSRAEAEFFVRRCPDTRMDGDSDGEPCENDSRF